VVGYTGLAGILLLVMAGTLVLLPGGGDAGVDGAWSSAGTGHATTLAAPVTECRAKLDANPGATFCFGPGRYETGDLLVGGGQRLVGQPGAVLDGTKVVAIWTKVGNLWVSSGQTYNPKVVVALSGTERSARRGRRTATTRTSG
jgi:hypothetical protein